MVSVPGLPDFADHVIEAAESAAGGTLRSEVEIRLKIFEGALSLPPSRSTMTSRPMCQ